MLHRHLAGSTQTEKPGKRVAVKDLELNGRVGKIVERLKDQHLEQEHNIRAFGTGWRFFHLRSRLLQDGSKLLPVDGFVQFAQWVNRLVDTLQPGGEVEEPLKKSLFLYINVSICIKTHNFL